MQLNQKSQLKDIDKWFYHWKWNQDIEGLMLWAFDQPFKVDSPYLQAVVEALFGVYVPLGTTCKVNSSTSKYWCTFPIFRKYCKDSYYIDPDWLSSYCNTIHSVRCEIPNASYTKPLTQWKG